MRNWQLTRCRRKREFSTGLGLLVALAVQTRHITVKSIDIRALTLAIDIRALALAIGTIAQLARAALGVTFQRIILSRSEEAPGPAETRYKNGVLRTTG